MNVILCWNRYIVSDDACHFKVRVWTVEALSSGAADENCQHSVLETVQYPCADSTGSFHPFLVANFSERRLFLQLTSLLPIGCSFLPPCMFSSNYGPMSWRSRAHGLVRGSRENSSLVLGT